VITVMTRKRLAPLLVLSVLILPHAIGNAQQDSQVLNQCVLTYKFHTGPSAPMFLSEYVVKVEPSHAGTLWYRFGPGSPEEGVTHKFQVSPRQYQTLIATLAGAGVLAGGWKTSNAVPTGADQEAVTIEEPAGKTVEISSILERESMARFREVVAAIRAAVPMPMWIAKDNDQRAYQSGRH
jgi:hypothetical protein